MWLCISVMLLILAVVLPTPHDYSGTFQGEYSARFTASRRGLMGARRSLETAKNYAGPSTYTQCVYTLYTHDIIICIHTHTHPYIHPYTHPYTNVYTHTYVYVVYTHAHAYIQSHTNTDIHLCTVCTHVCPTYTQQDSYHLMA